MTPDQKRSKKLEQIRALLAKASSTNFPEEAATFREHAGKLMDLYAVEEWEATSASPLDRPKPEMRMFDMSWWRGRNPFMHDHWWLMQETATHCRCVAVWWDWVPGQMKVVGLPADLDYFDLLFTQLMLEHGKRLEPKPDPSGEVGHEVFKLRQAGVPWPRITRLIYEAGLVALTAKERASLYTEEDRPDWDRIYPDVRGSIKNRLANFNRRYVRQNGLQGQRNYVNPNVYQRGFSEGFVARIIARMQELRGESEAEKPGDNHMAVALRDIRQVVVQWVNENIGPKPEPDDDDDKKSKAVSKAPAFSWAAYSAGSREGNKVNISNKPGQRIGGRRGLPEGS